MVREACVKFRFCGGLEPPDWVLAELPLLSGEQSKVATGVVQGGFLFTCFL
ncbi:uncharacterized protein PHALS_04094 [Plasmopara halstedii]|uniref:Uncharacterized protein n=1 Tax=Plasmopara halstedii TaxID=4781 RepID=A0A0P1A942_PLAHL|nr:uncharacterized protein PHALS_04094 [Plasmopara halstedii]CEG36839.1 hypothetical protein PHALS_04094 [Plasmopara halstedii]|eukprot:XP_024573208.1 hypothetical protein PHALS_04094 [Plasmopara halstedii]